MVIKPKGAKRIYQIYGSHIITNLLDLEPCLEPYSRKTLNQNSGACIYKMAMHTSFRYMGGEGLWRSFKENFINKSYRFPPHLNTLNKQFPKMNVQRQTSCSRDMVKTHGNRAF